MDVKMDLAREIVAGFHGVAAAKKAADEFQRVFRDRQPALLMKEFRIKRVPGGLLVSSPATSVVIEQFTIPWNGGPEKWSKLLASLQETASASEAERVVKQGGLEIDGGIVRDPAAKIDLERAATYDLRLGKKKFLRVVVE